MRIAASLVCLFLGVHQAAAQGAQFGPWVLSFENGCGVARNVVDADGRSYYTVWVRASTISVTSSGKRKIASGSLQAEHGHEKKLVCAGDYCVTDRDDLDAGLRSSEFAILKLELGDGRKAGPFNIPLEGLFAFLFLCGHRDNPPPSPAKPKFLNPEPEVDPQPKR
jgi:hypothetical protein